VGLVLGKHRYAADPGVEAVRQRKIDDAEFAAKKHRRLGAPVSQLSQTTAAATGEDEAQRLSRQPLLNPCVGQHFCLPEPGRGGARL
jgi:hypothetical protein